MEQLIDFDRDYMLFAAKRLKGRDEIKDDELEKELNDSMRDWLNAASPALGGKTPDEYFSAFSPAELTALLSRYAASGKNVPEPLYRRVASVSECAPHLENLLWDAAAPMTARATALRILCDTDADGVTQDCVRLLAEEGDLAEQAAEHLKNAGYAVTGLLTEAYETAATEDARDRILDVLCCYPGVPDVPNLLIRALYNAPEKRAMHAAMAEKLGDEALIEPLQRMSALADLTYFDYKEIVNAIDSLGGDVGEERQFYGDPDYEALRVQDDLPDLTQE